MKGRDVGRDLHAARLGLLALLKAQNYCFVTPTPLTHARVIARKRMAEDVRDVLGWSLPFERGVLEPGIVAALEDAGALQRDGDLLKSALRVSSLGDDLFLHSAYPTTETDAVFFGPDSYRFAAFIGAEAGTLGKRQRVADIGTGSGVGGIVAAKAFGGQAPLDVMFNDINPKAIELARANAEAAGVGGATFSIADGLNAESRYDLIVANPPYIIDDAHRAYRDGGDALGAAVSLAWADSAMQRLERGGVLLLYTGSAIVNGVDGFGTTLERKLRGRAEIAYRELDPDVFGEELERAEYASVERIAVVGVVATKL